MTHLPFVIRVEMKEIIFGVEVCLQVLKFPDQRLGCGILVSVAEDCNVSAYRRESSESERMMLTYHS